MLSSASELLLAIPRQTKFHWNKWSKEILAEPQSLSLDDFVIQKSLCKTGTCEILLCTDKNGEEVVLKKINNKKMDQNLLQNELDAGRSLQNGRIVKFYGHFQDSANDNTYLVLEYLKGCDLFTYMAEKDFKPLPEDHSKQIFIQVVKALLYVHKNNFAHRDIKMENIFLTEKGKVKLIDFGFATRTKPGEFYSQWCGSEDYVCPEILMQQPYCAENVDIWSLGVVLYLMLFARIPFYFKSRVKAILSKKGHPPLKFPDEDHPHGDEQTTFGTVSHQAKDLISQMLQVDPNKRISLHQVLKHPWLKNEAPSSFQKFLVMFNLQ